MKINEKLMNGFKGMIEGWERTLAYSYILMEAFA
jgi:hypothetical protein